MTRIDDRMRYRRRLVETAIAHAASREWDAAIDTNLQIIELGADAETYNRLGKAYLELGQYDRALEYYRETLNSSPANIVALKNRKRLEQMQSLKIAPADKSRDYSAPQVFIVDPGKTALTTLTHHGDPAVLMRLHTAEILTIEIAEDADVVLKDGDGQIVGYLEPQLAQRMRELATQGNRYEAVVANLEQGSIKVLIRETYVAPELRSRVAFPGKLGGDIAHFRTYQRDLPIAYDLESEPSDDDDISEDDAVEEEADDWVRGSTTEEEEVGLEEIEAEINSDDDEDEEN